MEGSLQLAAQGIAQKCLKAWARTLDCSVFVNSCRVTRSWKHGCLESQRGVAWALELLFRSKPIRTISGFFGMIDGFEFEFRRRGNYIFWRIRIFGLFKVQSDTMRPYMCLCCGLCVPTQLQFECCGVRDDWFMMTHFCMYIYIYLYIYTHFWEICERICICICLCICFRALESGLSKDLKDGERGLRRANIGGGSWRYWPSDRSLCLEKGAKTNLTI